MPATLHCHDDLPSTMDAAHELAARGGEHGATVWARRQSAARGTRGRRWDAGDGGLWLSVVARPRRTDAIETLSVRVGLALAAVLERELPPLPPLALKWPNDLLLGGRKVAGILCEARWTGERCQWVIVGVGVNVTNRIPDGIDGIGLASAVGPVVVDDLAQVVADAVADAAADAGPLDGAELASCGARDILRGRRSVAPEAGTVVGITAGGALRVQGDDGRVTDVLGGLVLANE